MKRTLLNSAMGLLFAGGALSAHAQSITLADAKFLVNSPSSLAGAKAMTNSGTNSWGRKIDSFWFNIPVVRVHDPTSDSLGCGTLNNGQGIYPTLRGGKFALVFRGDCEFGAKAKRAQDSGAIGVIIVNNIPGAPVGMGAGADGATVTIPVVMVSQADGQAMNTVLRLGQSLNVSITRWGFGFPNDLGIISGSIPPPHAFAIPLSQMMAATGNTLPYRNYTGAFVANLANLGSPNQTNVRLTNTVSFQPASGGVANTVYTNTLTDATFAQPDSVKDYFNNTTGFYLHPTTTGRYKFDYSVTATATDNQPADNNASLSLYITDSIFCKAQYDSATGNPRAAGGYRFGGTLAGTALTWGPLFYNIKGGYQAVKAAFAIASDATSLVGEGQTFVYMFRWRDLNNDKLITGNEMSLKGVGSKTYTGTDSNYDVHTAPLRILGANNKPVVTEDSAWYWVAVETSASQYMVVDYEANYYNRSYAAKYNDTSILDSWAPQLEGSGLPPGSSTTLPTSSVFHMFPFLTASNVIDSAGFTNQRGMIPSVALHLSKNPYVAGVGNTPTTFIDAKISPNPASSLLTLNLNLDQLSKKVQFSIIDAVGKNMSRTNTENVQNGRFNFNVSAYPAGNYYLIIGTDHDVMAQPFTVAGH